MFDATATVLRLDRPASGELAECEGRLREIDRVRSWLSNKHAETVRAIASIESAANARSGPKRARERVKAVTGCSEGQARRDTANAEQLGSMGGTSKGLHEGRISAANAAALARLRESLDGERRERFDAHEARLAAVAGTQSTDEFRATLRDWAHENSGDDGIDDAQRRHDRRRLTITNSDDNMGVVRAELDPENLETVTRTITDVANEMWHGTYSEHLNGAHHISNNQRLMADALVEVCRRASTVTAEGARRNRPTLILTADHERLVDNLEGAGISARLSDGTPIPAETARRLACDANILPIVLGGAGQALDVGRSRRLATDAQRAALRVLHTTCAAHGCDRPFGWCDIHHIVPWEAGGNTDLENLVPLCSHHHHLVHEGGWTFTRQPDRSVKFHREPDPPSGSRQTGPEPPGPRTSVQNQPTLV